MTKKSNTVRIASLLTVIFMSTGLVYAASPTTVDLETAEGFAVLAGSTITNTGSTVINGDLGLSPGSAVTGFPPGVINGAQNIANALAVSAQTSLGNAYSDGASRSATTIGTELGGSTRMAGVYDSASGTFDLTGTLTLDGEGDPNAVFIFKTSSTLVTAGSSSIVLTGGAQACNVFWIVGSSATLGANSTFKGNILAQASITLTTGANVEGRVLARSGAVTLDTNVVTKPTCDTPEPTPVEEEEDVVETETATTTVDVTATTTPDTTATTTVDIEEGTTVVTVGTTTVNVLGTTTPGTWVVSPTLPSTGSEPRRDAHTTSIAIGVLTLLSLVYLAQKKPALCPQDKQ